MAGSKRWKHLCEPTNGKQRIIVDVVRTSAPAVLDLMPTSRLRTVPLGSLTASPGVTALSEAQLSATALDARRVGAPDDFGLELRCACAPTVWTVTAAQRRDAEAAARARRSAVVIGRDIFPPVKPSS